MSAAEEIDPLCVHCGEVEGEHRFDKLCPSDVDVLPDVRTCSDAQWTDYVNALWSVRKTKFEAP